MLKQLTRRSVSTEQVEQEWQNHQRIRTTRSNVSHIIVTLADGTTEYLTGSRANVVRSYLKHRGSDNHIINLRWQAQPRHLLTKGA